MTCPGHRTWRLHRYAARGFEAIPHDRLMQAIEDDPKSRAGRRKVVKARREAAGLSQRQLAEIVGIRQPNIARLEAGDVLPTLGTLDRIADALGLTLEVGFSTTSG